MRNKPRTVVDHITVMAGARLEKARSPGIAISEPSSAFLSRTDKGRLLILVDTDVADFAHAAELVRDTVAREYAQVSSPSVTSCLIQALRAASYALYNENNRSLPIDRTAASAVCAVVRDGELYCAQVGDADALLLRFGELRRLVTSEALAGRQEVKLGEGPIPDVHLAHALLQAGDVIAFCSGSVLALAHPDAIAEVLSAGDAASVIESLYRLGADNGNTTDYSCIMLSAHDETRAGVSSNRRTAGYVQGATRAASTQTLEDGENATSPYAGAAHPAIEAPVFLAGGGRRRSSLVKNADLRVEPFALRSRARLGALGADEPVDVDEGRPGAGDRAVELIRRTLASARVWRIDPVRTTLAILLPLVLVAVLGACGLLFVRAYQAREQQEQVASLRQRAEKLERDALASQDATAQRRLLAQADKLMATAAELRGDDRSVAAARQRIVSALDQLSNVVRLAEATGLVDLGQEPKGSAPARLIVQGIDVFILDPALDRVYKYLLDSTGSRAQPNPNPILIRRGDRFGEAVVGDLLGMAWIPGGGMRLRGGLVILDAAGVAFEYDPAKGISTLGVHPQAFKGAIQSMAGYAGNLYIIDAKQNQLMWLPPSSSGYDRSAYSYLSPETRADLTAALDFTIDGSVYVLDSSGRIRKFSLGRSQSFDAGVPDMPLKDPSGIFTSAATKSVYVVDAGNARVVQFSKEGSFQRQFKYGGPEDVFRFVRAISVDEGKGKLYALSGNRVYVMDIGK
ncbi:MAG: hypothetical protein HY675_27160 [Chloroflexi bacterium]|nr:hypothetical protein [Chloroflexota bacterium]